MFTIVPENCTNIGFQRRLNTYNVMCALDNLLNETKENAYLMIGGPKGLITYFYRNEWADMDEKERAEFETFLFYTYEYVG